MLTLSLMHTSLKIRENVRCPFKALNVPLIVIILHAGGHRLRSDVKTTKRCCFCLLDIPSFAYCIHHNAG